MQTYDLITYTFGAVSYLTLAALIVIFISTQTRTLRKRGETTLQALTSIGVVFSLIYALLFLLEPLLVIYASKWGSRHLLLLSEETRIRLICKSMTLAVIGYLFFVLGYKIRIADHLALRLPVFSINNSGTIDRAFVISLFLLIGCAGAYIFDIGTILEIAKDPNTRLDLTKGKGYVFFLIQFYLTAILIGYLYFLDGKRGIFMEMILWLAPVSIIAFGGRADLVQIWATMLIIRLSRDGKMGRIFTLIFTAAILFVIGGVQVYRHSVGLDISTINVFEKFFWSLRHVLITYDNLLSYLHLFDQKFSYLYGRPIFDILYLALPTQLLGEKPVEMPVILAYEMYGVAGGTPFTIIGYLHNALAHPAIMIGMFAIGFILHLSEAYYLENKNHKSVQLIQGFLVGRIFIIIWGVISSGVLGYVQFYLQFLLAFLILTRFTLTVKSGDVTHVQVRG